MPAQQRFFRASQLLLASATMVMLAACGGGGGSGGTASSTVLRINGTAATGAAIANSTVNIKCSNGASGLLTANTTTDSSGTFTQTFAAGASAVPCLVQVQMLDAGGAVIDTLHGLATTVDAAGLAIANITPLTESILATALTQEDIAAYFAALTSGQSASLKTLDTSTAWAAIQTKITAQGISHSAITSPLAQVFSANSLGYDKVLDDLKAKGFTTEHLYRMGKNLTLPPTTATGILNDTGIDWCTENVTTPSTWVNNAVCIAINWVGNFWGQHQDALSGRDSEATAGTLTKIGSGMAGFDFTRIASSGKPLKIQNAVWSDTGTEALGTKWDCVRDNTTGYMWEVKRNELVGGALHLRHKDHTYTWFNSTAGTNGGSAGTETSATCTGVADSSKCNTQSYVTAVNVTGICGFKDWRMPNEDELLNLTHIGRSNLTIDANHFPNTQGLTPWWSSLYEGSSVYARFVNFSDGTPSVDQSNNAYFVRLVRSSQ